MPIFLKIKFRKMRILLPALIFSRASTNENFFLLWKVYKTEDPNQEHWEKE